MYRFRSLLTLVCFAIVAGCGWSLPSDPKDETVHDGVKYTAETREINSGASGVQFIVIATLRNTTNFAVTRTYPTACGVSIRLFRQADGALLYDETRRTCDMNNTVTITIASQQTVEITSGVRFPQTVAGDSLPFTAYDVRAVLRTEGTKVVEIRAGTLQLGTS